jgi:hypothetical protein
MSTRLQVLMDDEELREIREIARRQHMTVAVWVRQALRTARRDEPRTAARQKLNAIRKAAEHQFPTADIGQMLAEIRAGYLADNG